MPWTDWRVLSLSYFLDHVVKNFDVIDAHFNAFCGLFLGLVGLFEPSIRHDLLEAVAKFRVWHQDVLDQALNLLTQVAGELVASV